MAMAMVMMIVVVVAQHTERPVPPVSSPSLLCFVGHAQTLLSRKLFRSVTRTYFSFGKYDRRPEAGHYFARAPEIIFDSETLTSATRNINTAIEPE